MNFNIGDTVRFGREKGEKTLGTVVGYARSRTPKYKVRQDEARGSTHPAGSVWTVPESLMQRADGTAPANPAPQPSAPTTVASAFRPGDRVTFTARGMVIMGTVETVNIKTVTVRRDGGRGEKWRVPPTMLRRTDAAAGTTAIETARFTDGQRVEVRPLFGTEWPVGTVRGFDVVSQWYTVFVEGRTVRVPEKDIRPFAGTRTKDQIMSDFATAYCGLSPENLWCDGEASKAHVRSRSAQLNRWLRELAAEFGRMVDEGESIQWQMAKQDKVRQSAC